MKFKTKPGHAPTLKYKDGCGDKLHAFLPHGDSEQSNDAYVMILWTEGRVGLTRKKAVKFAKAILAEFGE